MDCKVNQKYASQQDGADDIDAREGKSEGEGISERVVLEVTLNLHKDFVTKSIISKQTELNAHNNALTSSNYERKRCKSMTNFNVMNQEVNRVRKPHDYTNLECLHHDKISLSKSRSTSRVVPFNYPSNVSDGNGSACRNGQLGSSNNFTTLERSVSRTEHALDCLRYINKATDDKNPQGLWKEVEKRFSKLANPDGLLPRASFASCIGLFINLHIAFLKVL